MNSAIRAVRMGAKFWKMRLCNLLLLLIYSWYKSGYLTLFCRPGSEFLLPEPDVILSSFHTGRVCLKITTYTRLSESAHYLEKRVLSSHPNGYWNRLPFSVWQRKRGTIFRAKARWVPRKERLLLLCSAIRSSWVNDATSYVVGVTSSAISHPGTDKESTITPWEWLPPGVFSTCECMHRILQTSMWHQVFLKKLPWKQS